MSVKIILSLDGVELTGELNDSEAGKALAGRLPLQLNLNRWGEEFYGDVGAPLGRPAGDTKEVMEVGELAFWGPGNAFCLFFGPTPASRGDEPRAASAAYPVGRVEGDFEMVIRPWSQGCGPGWPSKSELRPGLAAHIPVIARRHH